MKKAFLSFLLLFLFFLPIEAFAAVDLTLTDKSTTTLKSVSLTVESGTDALEGVQLTIEGSEDISFSEVNSGTVTCSQFTPTIQTPSIDLLCTFDEATVVDGIIANIIFTTESEDYSIQIVESSVDLGNATLGTVTNIGEVEEETEVVTTTGSESEDSTEEVSLVSTNTKDTTSSSSTFFGIDIMEYLPYILLGGSVILLISIVGVLLTRKKDDSVTDIATPSEPKVESSTETESMQKEPTLKDMVNQTNTAPTPVEQAPEVPTMQTATIPEQNTQQDDLNDLIAKENQPEVKMDIPTVPPVMETTPEVPTPQVVETPMSTPLSTPLTNGDLPSVMPNMQDNTQVETPPMMNTEENVNTENTTVDLQQLVNNEIQQIPVDQMKEEVPPVEQPQAMESTPTVPVQQSEDELPPVPPQM